MTDAIRNPEKSPFELCLVRWGVTRLEYDTTPHGQLFFLVKEQVCKSDRPEVTDSKIIVFRRDHRWGYAISVWNTMSQGTMWAPSIQCEVFNSRDKATLAGIAKFKQLATSKCLLEWIESLISNPQAEQLSLF